MTEIFPTAVRTVQCLLQCPALSGGNPEAVLSSSFPPAAALASRLPDSFSLEKCRGLEKWLPEALSREKMRLKRRGKQSKPHEKAAPCFPPSFPRHGPTRRGLSGSRQPGHRAVWLPKPGGRTIGPERMAASFLPVECSAWVSKFNSTSLCSNTRLSRTGENQQRAILGHFQLHLSQGTELWSHPALGRGAANASLEGVRPGTVNIHVIVSNEALHYFIIIIIIFMSDTRRFGSPSYPPTLPLILLFFFFWALLLNSLF